MKDKFISFETAKLAKEKGFDIDTDFYYDIKFKDVLLFDDRRNKINEPDFYAASTQSLLQKWLREKHNIIFFVYINTSYTDKANWIYAFSYHFSDYSSKSFETYEDALESALQISLNKIK